MTRPRSLASDRGFTGVRDLFPDHIMADNFVDSDDTPLPSHTPDKAPDGSSWSEDTGTLWDINSNQLKDGGGASGDLAVIESGSPNVLVQAIINGQGNNGPGLVIRYLDSTHHWLLQVNFISNQLQLYEINGGGYSLKVNPATGSIDNATDYVVGLQVGDDDEFHLILDGSDLGQHTSSSQSAQTKIGFRGAHTQYDDLRVSEI